MISVEKVDYSNVIFYSKFTFKNFFELMVKSDGTTLAFGASYNSEPCGLIVAEQNNKHKNTWDIKSLFVKKEFRRKGAGTALVKTLLNELKLKKCETVVFKTVTSQSSIDQFSSLLVPMGFSPLKKITNIYRFNSKELEHSTFVKVAASGLFSLPKNVRIVSMDKIDSKILSDLKEKQNIDYPDQLSPFANEHHLEMGSSYFAVTDKNEIVGWLTAFSSAGNIILYRSFFVKEEYRKTAVGFFLFNAVVKNHAANYLDKSCLFAIACDNHDAERFVLLYFKGATYDHKKYEFETTLNF